MSNEKMTHLEAWTKMGKLAKNELELIHAGLNHPSKPSGLTDEQLWNRFISLSQAAKEELLRRVAKDEGEFLLLAKQLGVELLQ